ncbi:MAG: hypothetical protein KDC24_08990 [Saprospiraceae bacterium]|nr:hypothetical protein [Saprospiraceae bacterium]
MKNLLILLLLLTTSITASAQLNKNCKDCQYCHGGGKISEDRMVYEPIVKAPTEKNWIQYRYQKLSGRYGKQAVKVDCYWCKGTGLDCSSPGASLEELRAQRQERFAEAWEKAWTFPYDMTWSALVGSGTNENAFSFCRVKDNYGKVGLGYVYYQGGKVNGTILISPAAGRNYSQKKGVPFVEFFEGGKKGVLKVISNPAKPWKEIERVLPAIWDSYEYTDEFIYGLGNTGSCRVYDIKDTEPITPEIACKSIGASWLVNGGKALKKAFVETRFNNDPQLYVSVSTKDNLILLGKKGEIKNQDITAIEGGFVVKEQLNGKISYSFVNDDGIAGTTSFEKPIKFASTQYVVIEQYPGSFEVFDYNGRKACNRKFKNVVAVQAGAVLFSENGLSGIYFVPSAKEIPAQYASAAFLKGEISATLKKDGRTIVETFALDGTPKQSRSRRLLEVLSNKTGSSFELLYQQNQLILSERGKERQIKALDIPKGMEIQMEGMKNVTGALFSDKQIVYIPATKNGEEWFAYFELNPELPFPFGISKQQFFKIVEDGGVRDAQVIQSPSGRYGFKNGRQVQIPVMFDKYEIKLSEQSYYLGDKKEGQLPVAINFSGPFDISLPIKITKNVSYYYASYFPSTITISEKDFKLNEEKIRAAEISVDSALAVRPKEFLKWEHLSERKYSDKHILFDTTIYQYRAGSGKNYFENNNGSIFRTPEALDPWKRDIPFKMAKKQNPGSGIFIIIDTKKGKSGTAKINGQIVIEPKYDIFCPYQGDYAAVCESYKDKKDYQEWLFVDKAGNERAIPGMPDDFQILEINRNNVYAFNGWFILGRVKSKADDNPKRLFYLDENLKVIGELSSHPVHFQDGSKLIRRKILSNSEPLYVTVDHQIVKSGPILKVIEKGISNGSVNSGYSYYKVIKDIQKFNIFFTGIDDRNITFDIVRYEKPTDSEAPDWMREYEYYHVEDGRLINFQEFETLQQWDKPPKKENIWEGTQFLIGKQD